MIGRVTAICAAAIVVLTGCSGDASCAATMSGGRGFTVLQLWQSAHDDASSVARLDRAGSDDLSSWSMACRSYEYDLATLGDDVDREAWPSAARDAADDLVEEVNSIAYTARRCAEAGTPGDAQSLAESILPDSDRIDHDATELLHAMGIGGSELHECVIMAN